MFRVHRDDQIGKLAENLKSSPFNHTSGLPTRQSGSRHALPISTIDRLYEVISASSKLLAPAEIRPHSRPSTVAHARLSTSHFVNLTIHATFNARSLLGARIKINRIYDDTWFYAGTSCQNTSVLTIDRIAS